MRWIGVRLDLASACITLTTALALILTKGSTDAAQAALALTLCIRVRTFLPYRFYSSLFELHYNNYLFLCVFLNALLKSTYFICDTYFIWRRTMCIRIVFLYLYDLNIFFSKVVSIMQFLIRLLNEVETRLTSIERLHQYEKVSPTLSSNIVCHALLVK